MLSEHAMRRQICAWGVSGRPSWASGAVFYRLDFHVMSCQALLIIIVLGQSAPFMALPHVFDPHVLLGPSPRPPLGLPWPLLGII